MAVALTEPHFNMFSQQAEGDDYARYPDPGHSAFSSGPLDTNIPTDAYSGFPRSAHDMFPNTICFEPSLYAETSQYAPNSCASSSTYPDDTEPRVPSSSLSTASAPSAASSTIGSPQSHHGHSGAAREWSQHGLGVHPGIVNPEFMAGNDYQLYTGSGMEEINYDFTHPKGFVDPSLIHPEAHRPPMAMPQYEPHFHQPNPGYHAASPSTASSPQLNMLRTDSCSPFMHNGPFQAAYPNSPYVAPMDATARRPSVGNFISPVSPDYHSGDESKGKGRCTYPDCGKHFKDLKAHLLTHMTERPEKCPILTCDYHIKGFARKYDKNRHTLTHYKGTMVCGFCPGSGSSAEKSFNRADVFKRHLTTVHGVEQTPPNSRKKTASANMSTPRKLSGYGPEATGKCSTCSQTFANAQDFYEHLDDCVLRIVQQEEPSEAINAQRLAEVENDLDVHQTLEKNNVPTTEVGALDADTDDLDMDEDEAGDEGSVSNDDGSNSATSPTLKKKANPANGVQKSRGLTHSRGGVALMTKSRGRKNRRDYPLSWGFDKGQMTMKKRVMAVFDGPRRLNKTELMLSTEQEVRIQQLSDGKAYVTDLDKLTLDRTEGFLNATEEEKGPWISDDPTDQQKQEMRELLATGDADFQ